ncbi:MAG: glycosyltransferase family 2 protein [Candidatus Hydrogenedentes bacterium]|nr:glycosyltransferase family 2 protein [Candidatus Hydrogenedentota bacterium]
MDANSECSDLRSRVAVVIPCYNAGARLRPVAARMAELVEHVIVVDDGSTDDGVTALTDDRVQVVRLDVNQGKGKALLEGFRAALKITGIECVCTCDADGQHAPDELINLYRAFVQSSADLVIGSRTFGERHVPLRSRLGNNLTIFITALLLGQRLPDTQSGYRLHSRRLVEEVLRSVPGGRYETEMEVIIRAARRGFRIVPAPISTIYETRNRSSHFHKVRDSFRIYRKLLTAVFYRR